MRLHKQPYVCLLLAALYSTNQTNTFMRKLYLLLATLLSFGSTAWADFHQPWTNTRSPWTETVFPWTETVTADAVTTAGMTLPSATDATYRRGTVGVTRTGSTGDVTLTFHYTSGGHALQILGVDLLNASSEVVYSDYTARAATGNADATFTLSNVAEGSYTLRYWVYGSAASSNSLTSTNGTITVMGLNSNYITSLEDLRNDKVYYFKSGRSSETSHYLLYHTAAPDNLSSTYGSGHSMAFDKSTRNFQFALYNDNGTYYMYNIEAGKFVGNATSNNTAIPLVAFPSNGIYLKPSGNSTYTWVMSTNNFTGALNAANTSGCHGVVNWTGGSKNLTDGGNVYQICEAGDLSSDIQSTISKRIAWGPEYTKITNALTTTSDVIVGAISTSAAEDLTTKCDALLASPSDDTYNAMVSAYQGAVVTLSEGDVFTIRCADTDRGYLAYSSTHSTTHAYLAGTGGSWATKFPSITDEGVSTRWAYLEKDGQKFLYNYDSQLFIGQSGGGNMPFNTPEYIEITAVDGTPTQHRIAFSGNTSKYLSFSPGYDGISAVRTYNVANDGGVKFYLTKVTTDVTPLSHDAALLAYEKAPLRKKLNEKSNIINGYIGSDLGQYNNSDGTAQEKITNAQTVVENGATTSEAITSAIADLDAITINMPKIGKLYRFKGKASGNYICPTGTGTTDSDFMAMNSSSDYAGTVFKLYEGDQVNGTTGYKLLNYGTGYFTTRTYCNGATKAAANSVKFAESPTNLGCYTIQSNASDIGTWLYDQDSKVNRNGSYAANNCDWTIEEVEYLPIPVNSTYRFGTFTSPVDLAITDTWYSKDDRLKFYIAEVDLTDNYVVLTKVENNIPANQSYVIEYVAGSQYINGCSFLKIADSAPAIQGTNQLRGSFETIATPTGQGTIYTLQPAWDDNTNDHNSATDVAFRQYNGTNIQGFRAYLPIPPGVQPAGMRFYEGNVTRIEGVEEGQTHKVDVYDLSGRRVQRATKGLYIVNGKKVLVK